VQWYNNFFTFLRRIGARRLIEWEGNTMIEVVNDARHYSFKFYNLPASLYTLPWILFFPLLTFSDKMSNIGLLIRIVMVPFARIESLDTLDTYEFLRKNGVSQRSIDLFWRFIVLSLLNVSLEECSAAEFCLLVKRWAYLKHRKFGFPKVGLGDIYADEAERYLLKKGGRIHRNCAVTGIEMQDGYIRSLRVEEHDKTTTVSADLYVSTVDPIQLRHIFREALTSDACRVLDRVVPVPYLSVNLWFKEKVTHKKFWAMLSGGSKQYLNTDFYDFSNIYQNRSYGGSYIASNVINSLPYTGLADAEIVKRTVAEIHEAFPHVSAQPFHSHVRRTPYVIYAPQPGSRALKEIPRKQCPDFYVTGDWTIRELPQCMEAAVRSGYKCAEEILAQYGTVKRICDDRIY